MFLTIEKVMILKSVDIFSAVNENELIQLAGILEQLEYEPGQIVFEKGAIGTSMYVIASGKVKVHNGDQELAILSERNVFGEIAALDPEPRLASITAIEDTVLFRLEQNALYDLMEEHIELARSVIHFLCQRYRIK